MAYSDDCLLFFVYFGPCSYIIVRLGGKKICGLVCPAYFAHPSCASFSAVL